jgi:hypothetical protein
MVEEEASMEPSVIMVLQVVQVVAVELIQELADLALLDKEIMVVHLGHRVVQVPAVVAQAVPVEIRRELLAEMLVMEFSIRCISTMFRHSILQVEELAAEVL